jgi:hypothetical protein
MFKATLEQNKKSHYMVLIKSVDQYSIRTIRGDEPLGNYIGQGMVIPLAKYPPHEI